MPPYTPFDIRGHVHAFQTLFPSLTTENALERIAATSGIPKEKLKCKERDAHTVVWRQAFFYTVRERSGKGYGAIAEAHAPEHPGANVRNGYETIKSHLETYGNNA